MPVKQNSWRSCGHRLKSHPEVTGYERFIFVSMQKSTANLVQTEASISQDRLRKAGFEGLLRNAELPC